MAEANELTFSFPHFIRLLKEQSTDIPSDMETSKKTVMAFRAILDNSFATDELLDSFTIEQLEWVQDLLLYWPSAEADREPEDYRHEGVQHIIVRSLIEELALTKPLRKKVTFI